MVPKDWEIMNRVNQHNAKEIEKIYLETNNSQKN